MHKKEITDFLMTMYKYQTAGKLVFHAFKNDKADTFTASIGDEFFEWVENKERDGWGIHLRQGRMKDTAVTSTKRDVEQVCHLWVDIDRPHETTDFVINTDDPLPTPTITINSGGGTHLYWRLLYPVDGVDLIRLEDIQRKLASVLGADPSPTHTAATLRLVGTLNYKYDPPVGASILRHNHDADITLDKMCEWLIRNENPYEVFADKLLGNVRASVDWKLVLDNLSVEGPSNEFGGRNNCVTKLSGWWARQGIDPDTQLRTLIHHGCNLPMREMSSIVTRIYEKECDNVE